MSDTQKYANSKVADIQRQKLIESLIQLSDADLCRMIHGHFENHRTRPGEKAMKDRANEILGDEFAMLNWDENEKLAAQYAQTRIRQTPLFGGSNSANEIVVKELMAGADYNDVETVEWFNGPVELKEMDISLVKAARSGNVYVFGKSSDGEEFKIGMLPPKFIRENPMNIDRCDAKLSLVDYSNGHMKNVAVNVVADVDEMSDDGFGFGLGDGGGGSAPPGMADFVEAVRSLGNGSSMSM